MTKKPSYRFVGFEDEWKEVKLGEVAEIVGGGTPSTSVPDYWDGDIDWYSPVEIGTKIFVNSSQRKITQQGLAKSSAKMLPIGTILFTSRAGIGSTAILAKEGCTNQGFQSIVPNQELLDNYFIFSLSHELKRYGEVTGAGSTFVEVSGKQMAKMLISLPSLPEQTAIGSFFQDIDQLISLQQRKLEVLKEQKKTYLKLLFPAKGQTKPALRFAGFEDDWKEVKLGDLILRGGSGGTPKSTVAKYYGGDIPFLSITDISNSGKYLKKTEKTITNEGLQNSSAWVVPEGAISLAMYASVGKLAILEIDCATSQAFYNMVFEDDIVRNFVYITLEKANIYNEWGSLISTGTQANLNAEKVKNFSFLHPSKPEQETIGSFFQDLDKAIAKQEEKVNQLKESKQTLLRKMFI